MSRFLRYLMTDREELVRLVLLATFAVAALGFLVGTKVGAREAVAQYHACRTQVAAHGRVAVGAMRSDCAQWVRP